MRSNDQPLVSIGMPVRNESRHIIEAFDALRNQTYPHFELIVADNASTDKTEEICRALASIDCRIRFFRHDNNMGAVANFAFVLSKARGEYFMWASGDDCWSHNWIETTLDRITDSNHIAAFGRVIPIAQDGTALKHNPAFGRSFPWTELRFKNLRAWRALFQDERLGKANLWYSLYKIDALRTASKHLFADEASLYDCGFVYTLTRQATMASCSEAVLYKRSSGEKSEAVDVTGERGTRRIPKRSHYFLQHMALLSHYPKPESRLEAVGYWPIMLWKRVRLVLSFLIRSVLVT